MLTHNVRCPLGTSSSSRPTRSGERRASLSAATPRRRAGVPSSSSSSWPSGSLAAPKQQHGCRGSVCRAVCSDQGNNQEMGLLLSPPTGEELQADQQWIAHMVRDWLDAEWTPLEVHQALGQAAGAAYVRCRQAGDDDMSSLVLGLSNELLLFDFQETFVNAFEVANKVVEMLMMRAGIAVCCTTDEDVERLERLRPAEPSPPGSAAEQERG